MAQHADSPQQADSPQHQHQQHDLQQSGSLESNSPDHVLPSDDDNDSQQDQPQPPLQPAWLWQAQPVLAPLQQRLVGGLQPDSDAEDSEGHAVNRPLFPSGLDSDSDSDDGFDVDGEDLADPPQPYPPDGESCSSSVNVGDRDDNLPQVTLLYRVGSGSASDKRTSLQIRQEVVLFRVITLMSMRIPHAGQQLFVPLRKGCGSNWIPNT